MEFPTTPQLISQLKNELYLNNIEIEIVWLASRLCYEDMGKLPDEYFDGQCEQLDEVKNTYRITLNTSLNQRSFRFYEVLAHEFKHVKQFASRQLIMPSRKVFEWEGKRHYFSKYEYNRQPHEIDAKYFGLEWALKNHPQYKKKKWNESKLKLYLNNMIK